MTSTHFDDAALPTRDELVDLYDSVGWTAYTQHPETLIAGVSGSLRVVTARRGSRLIGLARVVGDGSTIVYLQDVLVRPDEQRDGVGAELVRRAFEPFAAVRQQVLLTDTEERQRAFYEAQGFTELRDLPQELRGFIRRGPAS